ncbi:ABC transporter substrate-binding protein [Pseudomonas sp. No.21]|uniref:ABC transporter substrate-binding protein n=1 Tax=Pseudomonas TaxID=286 RepID=UPI000DA74D10|nr:MULTISPECIES: ABC transporter substrate-binding protein [Pseudomonas]MDW3713710.1 ABC transporter substrate-binding protein [Pseudomonas sp. 2023EL-01195]PZE14915.1 ABC transporter substrate-binding protein [Pseudomonas sp. 57B-090624]GJN45507.1 amino acid ABC transporter substrate-binding protein [Pseudomonas tohonis]
MKPSTALRSTALAAALLAAGLAQADVGVATPGQLKVGMDITYPPFESYEGDKVVGSDPDLAQALAKQLKLDVAYVNTKFAGLILGLNARHFDTVISGMYITPERTAQALAIPYAQTGASILVKADAEARPQTPEELCGLKVGLQQGTTWVTQLQELSSSYCTANGKGAITVSEYPSAPEATQAMISGHIQAQVEIAGAAKQIAERSRQRVVVSTPGLIYKQTLGIYVQKDNKALHDALLTALAGAKASGEYAAMLSKYSLEAPAAN